MRIVSASLGLLVLLLLLGALYYQSHTTALLQAEVIALSRERDATQAELRRLRRPVAATPERTAAPAAATAAERPRGTSTLRWTSSLLTYSDTVRPAQPEARPGVTVRPPAGWIKNSNRSEFYAVGVDSIQTWGGMPSAYAESLTPSVKGGVGGMTQTIAADDYAGKRVRLSGWVKTEDANEGGGRLWLRVDGAGGGQMLGFDQNRPIKGTADWQEVALVLDVPVGAAALAYGFFVSGGGKMWVNGQNVEVVGPEVPPTKTVIHAARPLPTTPRNLGFDPTTPPQD